ncbi:hypothetical protein PBI_SCTP2_217 [Salicola phage SCTP-2]|nr:hypothetical protein PBI_SCTP2_217 [Salicola phage SCTP-2]
MKINDLLKENDSISNEDFYYYKDLIVNSNYFTNNFESIKDGNALHHGTDVTLSNMDIIDITERSQPKDTDVVIHDIVNELSKQHFGIKIRNKLFITPNNSIASSYGINTYKIIPLGDYNIYQSNNIRDLYADLSIIINYDELESLIFEKIYDALTKHQYVNDISKLINKDFNKIIDDNKDSFLEDLSIISPQNYIEILRTGTLPKNLVVSKITDLFKNTFADDIDDIDDNDKENEIIEALKLFEQLLKDTIYSLNDTIYKIIKNHFVTNIDKKYIETIETTQKIENLDYFSESILDAKQALFLKPSLYADIIEDIIRDYTNED